LWFSSRNIVRPLQALEARAVELGWGNYQAIEDPVGGIGEIHNLQTELIHMSHKVRTAQEGLRDYIGAITLGQEDERRRLARELHDDTLQSLIALNQRLQLFQLSLQDDPQTTQHNETLIQLQNLAEQTIQDLRRITRAMRPIYLEDLGLVAALEMLTRETEQGHRMAVGFKRIGTEIRLLPEAELALYRIAQEALNNTIKHADADQANVKILFEPGLITLEISDEGIGFDVPESPAAFAPGGHFGLLGLYERAEMIGATLRIISRPGAGSQIIVTLAI
jgi:signal transduction histidine kinase